MAATQKEQVLDYLWSVLPRGAGNSEVRAATGVKTHQQVYMLTRELAQRGLIRSEQVGSEWVFYAIETPEAQLASPGRVAVAGPASRMPHLHPSAFERLAQDVMSAHLGVPLEPGEVAGVPKRFDLVSDDGSIVGDAKYYTLVRGEHLPPAKFSIIAEHVWLLEKTGASRQFLVFGNDRDVPVRWLARYGRLTRVAFYFLSDDGKLELLYGSEQLWGHVLGLLPPSLTTGVTRPVLCADEISSGRDPVGTPSRPGVV